MCNSSSIISINTIDATDIGHYGQLKVCVCVCVYSFYPAEGRKIKHIDCLTEQID